MQILDTNPQLFFHLQQQRLIELIRNGKVEEALEFAQEELAPRGEENVRLSFSFIYKCPPCYSFTSQSSSWFSLNSSFCYNYYYHLLDWSSLVCECKEVNLSLESCMIVFQCKTLYFLLPFEAKHDTLKWELYCLLQQSFLEELEKTVALLAFEDVSNCPVGELLDISQRLKTASEVNAAILTSQSHEKGLCLCCYLHYLNLTIVMHYLMSHNVQIQGCMVCKNEVFQQYHILLNWCETGI